MTDTPDDLPGPGAGSRYATPSESPGFLLWRATLRWQRSLAARLTPLGLTHAQFVLLASTWWLGRDGRLPSQRELADQAGTDLMMTSQVVRTLEARGYLLRGRDPADARVRRLAVTPAGEQLAFRAIGVVEAADAAFFLGTDQSAMVELLRRLGDGAR